MSAELTNLLPESRIRAFRRLYFLRLAAVTLTLLALLAVMHSMLLLPAYFYSEGQVARSQAELASIDQAAQTDEDQQVKARVATLTATANDLAKLDQAPVASAALRSVLAVSRTGVALTGFTFSAPPPPYTASTTAKMGVTGTATSRDALRNYAAALGGLPFVANADLPISAYAKETDIPFTITLTGTLKP